MSTFLSWLLILLVGAAAAYGLVKPAGWVAGADLDSYFLAGTTLVTLCFVLSRPSALGFPGWKASDLGSAKERCEVLNEIRDVNIVAVQYFIDHAVARAKQRASALWWLTGATWAIAAYLLQKGWEAKDGDVLGIALLPLLIAILCAGLIACYARAVAQVHGLARALLFDRQSTLRTAADLREARIRLRTRRSRQ